MKKESFFLNLKTQAVTQEKSQDQSNQDSNVFSEDEAIFSKSATTSPKNQFNSRQLLKLRGLYNKVCFKSMVLKNQLQQLKTQFSEANQESLQSKLDNKPLDNFQSYSASPLLTEISSQGESSLSPNKDRGFQSGINQNTSGANKTSNESKNLAEIRKQTQKRLQQLEEDYEFQLNENHQIFQKKQNLKKQNKLISSRINEINQFLKIANKRYMDIKQVGFQSKLQASIGNFQVITANKK